MKFPLIHLKSEKSPELLHLYKDVSVMKNYRILIYENRNKQVSRLI